MPVFTFMARTSFIETIRTVSVLYKRWHLGQACLFAHTDLYLETIDNVVPTLVSSLKEQHMTRLDLMIASKDFLRIFTDAANHIPRHRRIRYIIQLIRLHGLLIFIVQLLHTSCRCSWARRVLGSNLHAHDRQSR